MSEISKAENYSCIELRAVLKELLVGEVIPDSDRFSSALSGLDWFLPEVFREVYSGWHGRPLDGIYPAVARKTNVRTIEIIGLCIFIQDQTLTPLRLQLQHDSSTETVSWLECWLGEETGQGMLRIPYTPETKWTTALYTLADRLDEIDWTYHVEYGERQS